ncbi:MAG: sodium-dependent bicarbonate transport family permease, partial [Planctomycetota bacterium]
LLVGSLLIGLAAGKEGWESVAPFADAPFKGVLCLFLLDMGLVAGRRLGALRRSGPLLLGFALVFPMVAATLGIGAARLMGLSPGDALLFTVLCASASYIAVPAAVRSAIPQANPSLFLPMSLAVTFPFNIALGIPLYMAAIDAVWGIG